MHWYAVAGSFQKLPDDTVCLGAAFKPLQVEHRIMTFNVGDWLRALLRRSESLDRDRSKSRAPSNCIQMIIYMMRLADLLFQSLEGALGSLRLCVYRLLTCLSACGTDCVSPQLYYKCMIVLSDFLCISLPLSIIHTHTHARSHSLWLDASPYNQSISRSLMSLICEINHNHKRTHCSISRSSTSHFPLVLNPNNICVKENIVERCA